MSKKTKRTIVIIAAAVVLIAAAVIIFFVVKVNSTGYRSISIAEIFGRVIAQNNGKTYEAYKNMRLADGYELSTDPDSYTRMLLDDDKYVKLEQDSHAIFEALGDAKRHITTIRLDKGSLTTEITKPLTESESYVVNTPNAVLAVRGTLFRVEVKQEANGDYYCDVYAYGGSVASHRIMPDGTHVEEEIVIPAGYKATIKMDEIITVYLEEKIEEDEEKDNIDPLYISEVRDDDLVNVYNASAHGHEMFLSTEDLWNEIAERDIDLSEYKSLYDGNIIPPFGQENSGDSDFSNNSVDDESSAYSSAVISRDPPPSSSSSSSTSTGSNDNNTHTPEASQRPAQSSSASLPAYSEPVPAESEPSYTTIRVPVPASSSVSSTSRPTVSSSSSSSSSNSSRPETSEPVVHTHTPVTTTNPATCTAFGSIIVKCSECNELISSESISPLGHTPVTTTEPASCAAPGSITVKCSECGELISSESINPLGHTTDTVTTPSTCVEYGSEKQICRRCNALLGDRELPLADHTEIAETEGDITTVKCGVCGELISQTNNVTGVVYPVALDETNFPDPVFREYVTRFDEDGDGALSLGECEAVETVNVKGSSSIDGGITSLDGIEIFGKLKTLNCNYNSGLTELDVSKNAELNYLDCSNTSINRLDINQNKALLSLDVSRTEITAIDVRNNTALETLRCNNTSLTSLDVSENTALIRLLCQNTLINSLDVSKNTALEALWCYDAKIASLDVSKNPEIYSFRADGNEYPIHIVDGIFDLRSIDGFDLSRIIGDVERMDKNGVVSNITEGTYISYTYDCKGNGDTEFYGMFTLVPDESSTFAPETPEGVEINEENFPDEKFRQYVSENFDDGDGVLSQEECEAVINLSVSGTYSVDGDITSLEGIEHFSKLSNLYCYFNSGLTSIDTSKNTALQRLGCSRTQIDSLDLSNNTKLSQLWCSDTPIDSLDLSKNTKLTSLECVNTQITSLDVSGNPALTFLSCDSTQITSLDVSKNTFLRTLSCSDTQITLLDVSKNTKLYDLDCSNTQIDSLDLSKTALWYLYCNNTQITSLDISQNTELIELYCHHTPITSLDLNKNTALEALYCYHTSISSLDVSKNTALVTLECYNTQISFVDISGNPKISTFTAYDCEHPIHVENGAFDLNSIDGFDTSRIVDGTLTGAAMDENGILSGITEGTNITYKYDCKGTGESKYQKVFTLVPDESSTFAPETPEGVEINADNFPDEKFRTYVSTNFDKDSNGELSQEECEAVTTIRVNGSSSEDGGVTSLEGIENFSKLKTLYCYYNSRLSSLDISKNTALDFLNCDDTPITSLDVSKNTALTSLSCGNTQITLLDVSKNTALTKLYCHNTQITSLDVSKNTALTTMWCDYNQITSLDLSNNTALTLLYCTNTPLTSLDLTKNTELTWLHCNDTQITSLKIGNNTQLHNLDCYNARLTSLDVSKCTSLVTLLCHNNPLTSLDVSNNTALSDLRCHNTQLPFVDVSNCSLSTVFSADDCKYKIPNNITQFDITTDLNFEGFNPARVSNVVGANFSAANGIFYNFTSDEITYTYECKSTEYYKDKYNVTFTLVRTAEATASLNDDEPDDDHYSELPPNDTNTPTPPNSPEETGGAPNEDAALPPDNSEGLRFLPLGILALMRDRKRKTAFRVKRKAEI